MSHPKTRIRRGREVAIPEEWQGQVTRQQTIRKRQSKAPTKQRKQRSISGYSENGGHPRTFAPRHCKALERDERGDE